MSHANMLRDDYLYTRTTETARTMESNASNASRLGQDHPRAYAPPLRSVSPAKAAAPALPTFGTSFSDAPSPFSTLEYNVFGHTRPRQSMSDRSTLSDAFGFLQYLEPPPQAPSPAPSNVGPVWQDNLVLSETHYHHGDHHHNHHQRHVHHFHDLHLLGSAEEVLDLRNAPQPTTTVLGGNSMPQMKLRPDVVGRQAFETGLETYFSSLSSRFDTLGRAPPAGLPPPERPYPARTTPYDMGYGRTGYPDLPPRTVAPSSINDTTLPLRRTPLTETEMREAERRAREFSASGTEVREVREGDGDHDIQEVTTIVKTTRTVRQSKDIAELTTEERSAIGAPIIGIQQPSPSAPEGEPGRKNST